MAAACGPDTVMLVGSAPAYPHGVVDPIPELADLALRRGLWLHVDACVGGYIAPFAKMLGTDIPNFDFSLPGVTSISADLHKYGYTAKGASAVLYCDPAAFAYQKYEFSDWPRGLYSTQTLVGTRPGGRHRSRLGGDELPGAERLLRPHAAHPGDTHQTTGRRGATWPRGVGPATIVHHELRLAAAGHLRGR